MKNAFAVLLLSHGVPMLLAGDEFLHTQQGNNNCYCQDNELSWLNWDKAKENADVLHFVQQMIRLRKRHPALMRRNFLTGRKMEGKDMADISWHGLEVDQPPRWDDPNTRILAFTLAALGKDEADLHAILNMSDSKHSMQLPAVEGKSWCLAVDTAQTSPKDIVEPAEQKALSKPWYIVEPHSIVVFESTTQAGIEDGDSVTKRSANFFSKLTGIKLLDQPATEIPTS